MAEADDPHEGAEPEGTHLAEAYRAGFTTISRSISLAEGWDLKRVVWRNGLHEALTTWHGIEHQDIVDECWAIAEAKELLTHFGVDEIQQDLAAEFKTTIKQNGAGQAEPQQAYEYRGPDAEAEIVPPAEPKRATFYAAPDPATIPRRAWLHGGHYIRQAATATVAPGGFGKTTLTLYEAISMVAAGLVVWYLSGEDPTVEIDRRIAAHCKHHGIDLASLDGRLFVDDRSTFNLFIGNSPKTASVKFDEASLKQFEQAILIDKIDVVMLDPFVSFHAVPENDNGCIDAVVKRIALIAYRTNCCIEISHHVRKPFAGQGSITVDDARGGGAIINAVRSGRVINRMSGAEALNAKVEDDQRASYIRVDRGKRNMAPADKAEWFHLASVFIDNGDNVQALEPYTFPSLMDDITVDDTEWVRELVRKKRYRVDSQSKDWLGVPVAAKLGLDAKDKADRKKLHALIAVWLKAKVFKILELRDTGARKKFDFYVALDARAEGDEAPGMPDNITPLFDRDDDD